MFGVFGIYILALAIIMWIMRNYSNVIVKYLIILCYMIIISLPIFYGFSAVNLIYSFFDSPSILCILICIAYIFKKDSINNKAMLIYFIYGLALYLGSLIFPYLDFYHDPLALGIVVLCLVIALMLTSTLCFILTSVTLFIGYLLDISMANATMCVYLWVYCMLRLCKNLVNFLVLKKQDFSK